MVVMGLNYVDLALHHTKTAQEETSSFLLSLTVPDLQNYIAFQYLAALSVLYSDGYYLTRNKLSHDSSHDSKLAPQIPDGHLYKTHSFRIGAQ